MTEIDDLEDIGQMVISDVVGPRPDNVKHGRRMLTNMGLHQRGRPGFGHGRIDPKRADARLRKF